jgi:hypothetical protein
MGSPGCSFSFETSSTTFPSLNVELFHSASSRVVATTNLGMLFILSAKPTSSVSDGQASANLW